MVDFFSGAEWLTIDSFIIVIYFIYKFTSLWWFWHDAKKNQMGNYQWFLIVIITGAIGIVTYFILRKYHPILPNEEYLTKKSESDSNTESITTE